MLDIKYIVDHLEAVQKGLQDRGADIDLSPVLELNDKRKSLQAEFDGLRAEQNQKSKEIGKLQKEKQDAAPAIAAMKEVAERVHALSPQMHEVDDKLRAHLLEIPNIPHESVPVGLDESANTLAREWGEKPSLDFKPKEHWELGEALNILDFERGAKIAGSRFTLYRGAGARLERALINFMLDIHTSEHGYEEVLPPFMANTASLTGTGQLPKFEEDLFKTTSGHYLIPTAEVPVTNIYRDEMISQDQLPIKFCAYTPCFRSEAGSYGKDIKGLIRQHQFNKVELVQWVDPSKSYEALEELTGHAETILQKLNLPYRVMTLCSGDMGFSSAKTYDLEVWLPGQNAYREISSCSNFVDYQARRLKTRFKDSATKKNQLVHTLNGSGIAVGRALVAILENYQMADGSVKVPEALKPYLNGLEVIK